MPASALCALRGGALAARYGAQVMGHFLGEWETGRAGPLGDEDDGVASRTFPPALRRSSRDDAACHGGRAESKGACTQGRHRNGASVVIAGAQRGSTATQLVTRPFPIARLRAKKSNEGARKKTSTEC